MPDGIEWPSAFDRATVICTRTQPDKTICPFRMIVESIDSSELENVERTLFTDIDPNAGSDLVLCCRTAEQELGVVAIQCKSGRSASIQDSIESVTPGFQYRRKSGTPTKKRQEFETLMSADFGHGVQRRWLRVGFFSELEFHPNLVNQINKANETSTQPVLLLTSKALLPRHSYPKVVGKQMTLDLMPSYIE